MGRISKAHRSDIQPELPNLAHFEHRRMAALRQKPPVAKYITDRYVHVRADEAA
jgi:hypothetical protein